MFGKNNTSVSMRMALVLILLTGSMGVTPVGASAEIASRTIEIESQAQNDCEPDTGWMWTNGPMEPETAAEVQKKLSKKGIEASVQARSYGETDSCGTYNHHGIDFTITLSDASAKSSTPQEALMDEILPVLVEHGKPNLGNVKLISGQGEVIPLDLYSKMSPVQTLEAGSLSTDPITKNVYVIVYDPIMSNGQTLSDYLHWNDHATITQQTIDFFSQTTNNRLNYNVVDTAIVNGWPELIDGFTYTEQEFLAVWANPNLHHEPTGANYNKIVNAPEFDICGRLDRGEIDEVWIYNGPWFGFYESRLVGPGAYPYNSPPVDGANNCNKILPIMGPSVERTVQEAVHNFTHRTEDTMKKVYGSWQQNNISHNWNKFGLVKAQSPNYSYSGCGSSHYPPNGVADYDYGNVSSTLSNCADFLNYPNLGDPLQMAQPVTCSVWGCGQLDYFRYWFGHFPASSGCGPDNVANDWWKYLSNPGAALYPSNACQVNMHLISGNVGTGNAVLNYVDGTARSVTADAYGNYFLMVSDHWTGTVTPEKARYTFTPAVMNYTDVLSDQHSQNYTAQGTTPRYYVNITTGNNNNTCTSVDAPCRNIQEAINKANSGDTVYMAGGTYQFSTNGSPNVVILQKDLTLSGGWNSDFTVQNEASVIDGQNLNNGILLISGTVVVDNFTVTNSISSNSGAIYIVNGNFTLTKSTLRNNTATSNGAGIFLDNGVLNVINSTISGNRAYSRGGGIYVANNGGAVATVQNSTIVYNSASTGGGIVRTTGTFNMANTIVANNSGSNPDCSGTLAQAYSSIIENQSGCSITSGSGNLNVDPNIDANLTGTMPVHMLLQGSPAINAGEPLGCTDVDQLGTPRPQGDVCDIGSIEYIGQIGDTVPPVVVSVTRANDSPTLAAQVDFNVTFSENVTGVDANDFSLATSGLSGSTVNAVSGSGSLYTVSVATGTGNGTLRLDVVDDDSILDAASNPLGGIGSANGNFTLGESYTVPQLITLTAASAAAIDGWILESAENSNIGGTLDTRGSTFDAGDDKANKQYVDVLHFDTSSLPDGAVITAVTLKVKKQGVIGTDPFTTHGSLLADIQQPYFGTTAALVASDFQATPGQSEVSTFNPNPVSNWYSAMVDSAGYFYINLNGTTQFRLHFALDDDNDKRADTVKFYSGNGTAANSPQLIIQYYIP
jgi:hypothetical protein